MINERYDNSLKTYVIFLLGILFLSFTAPWQKMGNFDPATGAFLRVLGGALVLIPFAIREAKSSGVINKKGFWLSVLAGAVLGIDFTAWNYSIFFVGSGIASILLNIQVIIMPALAFFVDKEKIPLSYYLVAPVMLIGVVLAGGALESGIVDPNGPQDVFGMPIMAVGTIAGLTSGLCYSVYLFAARRAGRIQTNILIVQPILISSIAQMAAPLIFAYVITGNGFDFTNGVMIDTAKGISAMRLPIEMESVGSLMENVAFGDPINGVSWFWMAVECVLGQAAAWTFAQYGSAKLNPTLGAALLILSPIATVALIAPVMFHESLSSLQIFGVIIAILAVMYQNGLWKSFKEKFFTNLKNN
ncbi:DMT family transporter [Salmonella enterica]|uniref:DMT family transporter n=1 Tax=Salmonella enterica TaxID=28901 RepID=A0A744GCD0_SALER|nr:DMT family transporter [Salmonella enterica subsp. enterica serovar Flottbek]EBX2068057.1 DMT family transporter [Salmonella enterica subsp. enterica serovar Java]ECI2944780.1 DMT family transporter [Salmonella enterica subsp. diarizonae]EDS2241460.1 DMT family transporter [Salmonella enterica]EHE8609650.1 DMT family transporter [Salmonella enterica subsp. enterica serovar 4,[5],12:b:-]